MRVYYNLTGTTNSEERPDNYNESYMKLDIFGSDDGNKWWYVTAFQYENERDLERKVWDALDALPDDGFKHYKIYHSRVQYSRKVERIINTDECLSYKVIAKK